MSSIITNVFNLAFGLLWGKVRDVTANRLQEGDVTDQKCRELIVRELDDITTKLDGLVRKDLLSSISFLKEGFCLLNFAIQKVTDNEEAKEEEDNLQDEAWCILNHGGNFDIHETWPLVLSEAAKKLKITSEGSFASAKDHFKAAREKATEAFNNEALSIEDRILATKLRMISRIFESLEEPDPTAETCKLCIKELHDVPAVKEMFSVYLNGGIKSHFNKTKRLEMVMSVNMINFVLFDFICKFTKLPLNLFNWPRIKIGDRMYHPILENSEIMENVKQSGGPRPIKQSIGCVYSCSVNSKREIVAWDTSGDIKVLNTTTSKWRLFCTLSDEMIGPNAIKVWKVYSAIAVHEDDNVYIVVTFQTSDDVYHYTLFVFDTIGNLKYISTLEFLNEKKRFFNTRLVLSKDRSIIHRDGEKNVWVCDHRGQLKYKFPAKTESYMYLMEPTISVSDKNEIIAAERRGRSVYIYTEEGEMKRRIKVSEGHEISGVVFNHTTKTIIVGTWQKKSYFMTSYSETGEQQDILEIPFRNPSKLVKIITHPSGHVVFVQGKHIIFV